MQSQQLAACCNSPAPYIDMDEWRCRTCGRSLSVPPRGAKEEENPGEDRDSGSLVKEGGRGSYVLPDFDPPSLLRCSCCEQLLPASSFTRPQSRSSAKNRQYRASICRPCTAFRLRVKRPRKPRSGQGKCRGSAESRLGGEVPGKRIPDTSTNPRHRPQRTRPRLTKACRCATAKAKRHKSGNGPVMKQRSGRRLAVLLKPVCRGLPPIVRSAHIAQPKARDWPSQWAACRRRRQWPAVPPASARTPPGPAGRASSRVSASSGGNGTPK